MTKTHVSEVPPFHIHRTHIYTHTHNIFVAVVVVIASPLQMCLAGTKFMIYALQYYYIHIYILYDMLLCAADKRLVYGAQAHIQIMVHLVYDDDDNVYHYTSESSKCTASRRKFSSCLVHRTD